MKQLLNQNTQEVIPEILPIIPTMDVVVFPHMIVPLLVMDEKIIRGINESLQKSKMVLLLAAKNQIDQQGAIGTQDLHQMGTVASIMRMIKIPEGGVKVLVQGICKAKVHTISTNNEMLHAEISAVELEKGNLDELIPQVRSLKNIAETMAASGHTFSPDFHIILSKMQDPEKIADFILSHLNLSVDQAQSLLEAATLKDFLEQLYKCLNKEVEVAQIQEKIMNDARESMNQSQKEYYLREQLKAIKRELGDDDGEDIEEMRAKLETITMPEETKKEVLRQINRLEKTSPESLEATVTRNYLEWIFALPWGVSTKDNLDVTHASNVLNEDHYGLKSVKDRILDFISIKNLKKDGYSPIICFVGPPGVGKTSLGKSIAKSLGRTYARISLGGVKDEAEIRGHRRTYVGAMPGRFIQAIRKAGSLNPVVVIDELDKIGSDFRGDPSAAMLEVLDPHQNKTFYDNYLGVPFDISNVLFIATANSLDTISGPLRDRMEIIQLSGYTMEEKINIAKKYLLARSQEATGLEAHTIDIGTDLISDIVSSYTRESGVRQLERIMTKLYSKAARHYVEKNEIPVFTKENIETFLGPRHFLENDDKHKDTIGISNGLAWTSYGGEMLKIEAMLMPGKGKFMLTGQLGDVMKESAQAAMSYARAHAKEFNIDPSVFEKNDLHIHIPAGATPKDGPSAGITMLTAILSALTNRPINSKYAMTGELNLRGEVMPIGGVKEKILAAKRSRMTHVIFPHKNKHDFVGLESEVSDGIEVIFVEHANQVLDHVLHELKGE
jgi:ATP-dependent Lon protease